MTVKLHLQAFMLLVCFFLPHHCFADEKSDEAPAPKQTTAAKIALIPLTELPDLNVENRGSPLNLLALPGFLVQRQINKNRAQSLASVFQNNTVDLCKEMTVALQEQLRLAGFSTELITELVYLADDPGEIDYAHLNTDAEVVLLARFTHVGLYSGQFSRLFLPRLNFEGQLIWKKDQEDLFYDYVYYGADAGKPNDNEIPSDPKYAYASFGEAYERDAELVESYRIGIQKIAARFARQLQRKGLQMTK